jgi:hypothetical protein
MVSTLLRCLHGSGSVACVLLAAMTLLTGCTRVIDGTVRAATPAAHAKTPMALADLLIEPNRFPAHYPAVVLDAVSVDRAIREIDGVGAGSVVTPAKCTPPSPGPSPRDAVAVQSTSSNLTVALTRVDAPLSVRRDQLRGCPSFTTTAELSTTVTVTLLAAPPVDADDTYSVEQSVSTSSGPTLRTLAVVAQIADVRVIAAWTTSNEGTGPDTPTLDNLFTDAVLKVRRDGRS